VLGILIKESLSNISAIRLKSWLPRPVAFLYTIYYFKKLILIQSTNPSVLAVTTYNFNLNALIFALTESSSGILPAIEEIVKSNPAKVKGDSFARKIKKMLKH
jgi:hypothetical protein